MEYMFGHFSSIFLNLEVVPYLTFHRFKKNSSASTRLRFFTKKEKAQNLEIQLKT